MKAIYSHINKKQNTQIMCVLLFLLLKTSKTFAINAKLNEMASQNEISAKASVIYSGSNGSKEDE